MNKSKKFLAFVESIVDDTNLLKVIKDGFKICTESIEHEGGDVFSINVEEFEYPVELAKKYFDLPKAIHEYKKEYGEDYITDDSISVGGEITIDCDIYDRQVDIHEIVYIRLDLYIDGDEVDSIEIESKEKIDNIDQILDSVVKQEADRHIEEIENYIEQVIKDNEEQAMIDNYEFNRANDDDYYY